MADIAKVLLAVDYALTRNPDATRGHHFNDHGTCVTDHRRCRVGQPITQTQTAATASHDQVREHACSLRPSGTAVALGGSPMNVVTGTQFAEKLESAGVGIWNSGLNRSYFNAQPRRPPRPGDVRREPPVRLREEDHQYGHPLHTPDATLRSMTAVETYLAIGR